MLDGLLAPLRLPERVLEALEQLRPMRSELMRVREQTESLPDLLPALQRLEDVLGTRLEAVHDTSQELGDRVGALERTVQELAREVGAIHETLVSVKDDIQRTTGLRGDRGMMERARDALTGGDTEHDRPNSPRTESGSRDAPPG